MSRERMTSCGPIRGNERPDCEEYLGVRYARAGRFRYAVPVERWEGSYDATHFGPACCQYRQVAPHLDVPERAFYHREFREGLTFTYSEDCLNLNIYVPKTGGNHPVLLYYHGGGFNSMANSESYLDGAAYARRGVILVAANYRVGVFGYLTHEEIERSEGRDGNFGLDDQMKALRWVRRNIAAFGGDPENITIMGQSAGAISVQLMLLSSAVRGCFRRAVMLSGAGAFPRFAQPKDHRETRAYWLSVIEKSGAESFEAFRALPAEEVLRAVEQVKAERRDNVYNTQPVIDGLLLPKRVGELIRHPAPVDTLVGYTNRDMYTALLAGMAHRYARANRAYLYCFDADAPGDGNAAFHSSDLRYVFGTLNRSWRPYDERDEALSALMLDYLAAFCRTGDPNGGGRPRWEKGRGALILRRDDTAMGRPPLGKLLRGTFMGEPK